jgi:hypothetical protein
MMRPHHIFLYYCIEARDGCRTAKIHLDPESCIRSSMDETHRSPVDHEECGVYEIRIKGHLSHRWVGWFEGMTITLEENDTTLLIGAIVDQAALHGLLKKVRDSGMPLVSVNPIEHVSADAAQRTVTGVESPTGTDSLLAPDQSQQGV